MRSFLPHAYRVPAPWWLEIFSALTALMWALGSYLLDGSIANKVSYSVAMQIMPHATWEMFAIILASLQLCSSARLFGRGWRVAVSGLLSAFWFLLGYTIYLAEHQALGIVFYLMWGLGNLVSMLLGARPVRIQDEDDA